MNQSIFSKNLYFLSIAFDTEHYTDNRKGSPHHFLAYMEQGHCRLVSESGTVEIAAGDLFYIPKDLPYQSYWTPDPSISFLSYGFDDFPESRNRAYLLQKIHCPAPLCERLRQLPVNTAVNSRLYGRFYSLLAEFLPFMTNIDADPHRQKFERIRQYLQQHPHLSMAQVATDCLISESGLYDLFRRFDCTPNECRQQALCARAELLLQTTDRSVQEISDSLGFSSPSYVRKVLHQHTGRTPRELRKQSIL